MALALEASLQTEAQPSPITLIAMAIIDRYRRNVKAVGEIPWTSGHVRQILAEQGLWAALSRFAANEAPRHIPDSHLAPEGDIVYQATRTAYAAASVARGAVEGALMTLSPQNYPTVTKLQSDANDYYDADAGGTYRGSYRSKSR